VCDAEHEAGHVRVADAVELPLAELDGCRNDGLRAGQSTRVELVPQRLVTSSRFTKSSVRTKASSSPCAAPCAIVGGQLWAASPMMMARPRFHGSSTMWWVNHV